MMNIFEPILRTLVGLLRSKAALQALKLYQRYYNESRTHLSLDKDAPISTAIETIGRIVSLPVLGGLHRRYARI